MLLSWRSLSHSTIQLSSPWAAELHQRPFLWEGIATEQTQLLLIEQKRGRYDSGSAHCVLTGHNLTTLLLWDFFFKLGTFSFKFYPSAFTNISFTTKMFKPNDLSFNRSNNHNCNKNKAVDNPWFQNSTKTFIIFYYLLVFDFRHGIVLWYQNFLYLFITHQSKSSKSGFQIFASWGRS
jgi:hypothetical protein